MSSSAPLVSVVLPTYNREAEIPRAIRSVLDQSYASLELLVVDDASTDATERVVERFGDARIRYIRHDHNKGAGAARNTGARAAGGEFIAFQDSDDEWLPPKLELQMQAFDRAPRAVAVVYCGYWRVLPDGGRRYCPPKHVMPREGDVHRALLRESFIGTPTIVARRECLESVGWFDESMPRFQDWELMIRISERFEVRLVDEPLVIAHFVRSNITAGHDRALEEAERRILDKHRETLRRAGAGLLAHRIWHLGHVLCLRGEMTEGRKLLREALRERVSLRHLASLVLALHPRTYGGAYRLWSAGR